MPTSVTIFGYLLAFGAGVSFVFQQAVNANLRVEIGSPWWAGFVSYLGGTIAMLLMAVVLLQPWPSMQMIHRSHWLSWTGGVFGVIYIAISILLLPRLGAATVIALIVAGQMIGALAFDQFGLLGVPTHPLNMLRLVGAGPLLGSLLTRLEMPSATFFYVTAIGPLLCAGCCMLLLRRLRHKRHETAAA